MITAKQAKEVSSQTKCELPDEWLTIVLLDVDKSIKYHLSSDTKGISEILWKSEVEIRNVYNNVISIKLTESQRQEVCDMLSKYGFIMSKSSETYLLDRYKISW